MKVRGASDDPQYYDSYKGRGIDVCDRWKDSFENFLEDMGPRPIGMTLDRRDNNKGYSPENCRWATDEEQGNNKRGNVLLEIDGVIKTVSQWSRVSGISKTVIRSRMKKGWSDCDAVFTPLMKRN